MNLASAEKTPINQGFEQLRRELVASGRFERMAGSHLLLFLLCLSGFGASYGLGLAADSYVMLFVWVAAATVCAVQLAYIAHDAGHGQIASSRAINRIVGELALTVVSGYAFSSWVQSHSRHHAHPNCVGRDPDVESDFVALHPWAYPSSRLTTLTIRLQHWFIAPLYTMHLFTLRVDGVRDIFRRRLVRDGLWVGAHVGALLLLPAMWFPIERVLLCYVAVTMASGLYYGPTFLVNHVGVRVFGPSDQAPSFVVTQVVTSRNILIGRVGDLVLGGLNFQIEHHLFPDLPRFRLRKVSDRVKSFCAKHELQYEAVSLKDAVVAVFNHLRKLSSNAAPSESLGSPPR